jgi:hypothetical protein
MNFMGAKIRIAVRMKNLYYALAPIKKLPLDLLKFDGEQAVIRSVPGTVWYRNPGKFLVESEGPEMAEWAQEYHGLDPCRTSNFTR